MEGYIFGGLRFAGFSSIVKGRHVKTVQFSERFDFRSTKIVVVKPQKRENWEPGEARL